jgi:hypothetical protein
LREVSRRRLELGLNAFRDGEDDFLVRKGEHKALKWIEGKVQTLEAEVFGLNRQEEDDE